MTEAQIEKITFTDEELIIEHSNIRANELKLALKQFDIESDEKMRTLEQHQIKQTEIYHLPIAKCNDYVIVTRSSSTFYICQRKEMQYLILDLQREKDKLQKYHDDSINSFNNLFLHLS